jgi:hypothetical protein
MRDRRKWESQKRFLTFSWNELDGPQRDPYIEPDHWSRNMSDLERTAAGLQMIIPGCERRTLPRSTTRVDEIGQGLLSFYKPPGLREQLASRANAPLRPSKGQKALPKSGLFGPPKLKAE